MKKFDEVLEFISSILVGILVGLLASFLLALFTGCTVPKIVVV